MRGDESAKVEGEKDEAKGERTFTHYSSGAPTFHCSKSRMRSYLLMTRRTYGRTDTQLNFKRGGGFKYRFSILAEKRTACLMEINKLKSMIKNPDKYANQWSNVSSKGTVTISNLHIPLKNDFVDARAKGKGI